MSRRAVALATAVLALSGTAWAATTTSTTYARQAAQGRAPYGGAKIAIPGSRVITFCGLGVNWRLSNGSTRTLTAGHCVGGSGGTTVRYRNEYGAVLGSVVSYRYGGGRDYALIAPRYRVTVAATPRPRDRSASGDGAR